MIFYQSDTKSEALRLALQDERWSENEKKALAEILRCVEVEEENQRTMHSEEWIENPTALLNCPPHVQRGTWVNGQDLYTCRGQKYMIVAGDGYRVGKCYPATE